MQDSAIRTWLVDRSRAAKQQAAGVMATLGGVRATYYRDGDHYDLRLERAAVEVDERGVGVVAQARPGDREHRGRRLRPGRDRAARATTRATASRATTAVRRSPCSGSRSSSPGRACGPGSKPGAAIRSVDIMPTVLRALGIPETYPTDGRAYRLP